VPQQPFNASVQVVEVHTQSYQGSVDPVRDVSFSGSMVAGIEPDRRTFGSVETVPPDGPLQGYNGSVRAFFVPITPDRQHTGSVRAVTQATLVRTFSGSITRVNPAAISQLYTASLFKSIIASKVFTGSVVPKVMDGGKTYTASLRIMPFAGKDFRASAVLRATIEKLFRTSVRPYRALSPGEQAVYDEAVRLLIGYVLERDAVAAQIAALTARLAVLNDDIARVLAILLDVDNKPSVLLNVVSPSTGLRRSGGETVTLFGTNFIPTNQVRIKQGVNDYGLFATVQNTSSQITFTSPDFSLLAGIVLTDPLQVRVENPNGEVSEYLSFTLGTT
jgi:hypothetical protein